MWNKEWQPLIDDGSLQVLGIVQEQHAERTNLYQQWQQYKWPIVQDALNLMQVKVVPLVIAIDENGVVVSHNARGAFIKSWLAGEIETPESKEDKRTTNPEFESARQKFLWEGPDGNAAAIAEYEALVADSHTDSALAHFELAVCYRNRFEQDGKPGDFQNAIDHWSTALKLDPNQYIYSRRIQQYGARLGKPYPFYDWVSKAQEEIRERGEEPIQLSVAISGAEIAQPIPGFEALSAKKKDMDWAAANEIQHDDSELLTARAVAVPARVKAGSATRVHVLISPGSNTKWNNEAGPSTMVLKPNDENVTFSQVNFEHEMPDEAESNETRRFEFEVLAHEGSDDIMKIRGAVLINVCLIDSGVCTYLRKPFELTLRLEKE